MAEGTHQPKGEGEATVAPLHPTAPEWITDANARAEWDRLMPELIRRKKYLPLFENELARYCVEFGIYRDACAQIRCTQGKRKGQLNPVTRSSKKVEMLSMHRVVMGQAHKVMQQLAGDLGLNPVAMQRIENLQLDLFAEPPKSSETGDGGSNVTPFGQLRRR